MLLKFIADEDPMQSMLKWLCERLMEAEVENKLCAEKSERNNERQGYRSGYRVRRFDTRMGTIYLMVPKIRNGGYIPFFVETKRRSEAALMNVIQEAYINNYIFNVNCFEARINRIFVTLKNEQLQQIAK